MTHRIEETAAALKHPLDEGSGPRSGSVAPAPAASAAPAAVPPPVVAPIRLALVRAALAIGAFAVFTVETAGALGQLTGRFVGGCWLTGLLVAATLAGVRFGRSDRPAWWSARAARGWIADFWTTASRLERLLAGVVAGLVGAELLVALLAEPNSLDSQVYHLPRVEHWVAQGSLKFWPTVIDHQLTIPPGAEYLLLQLRLLTGGDTGYNLLQWAAGVGCLLVASRIAAQLGGGRRAQLLTAFVIGTTPMVTLQASGTLTDLVVAAWAGCVATLVLDWLNRPATVGLVLALGAATGLTAVTKTTGLLGAVPMLALLGVTQVRLALRAGRPGRLLVAGIGVAAVAGVLVGPFLLRVYAEFGHPLGPPALRDSFTMQRHDAGALLVNGLRIGHTALNPPLPPVSSATATAIGGLARTIGVDPQGRDITFGRSTFPAPSWYPNESVASFPLTGGLVLIGCGLALLRPGRLGAANPGLLRGYALACTAGVLLYVGTVKWQPWGNRLLMYALVLGAPLAGRWLDGLFSRRPSGRRSLAVVAAAATLAGSALAGVLAVGGGAPRPLVGPGSVVTTDAWGSRFSIRPEWAEQYRTAADKVLAAGARRIGVVQEYNDWEYPWWLLLTRPARPAGAGRVELVSLRSVLPRHSPADPRSVDAIVCTGDRAGCVALVPAGWRLDWNGYVGYALPPG